ncbi:MAG TPA: SRPBCC domain-containing protein [Candidatus Dormibacteraeota bacterium]
MTQPSSDAIVQEFVYPHPIEAVWKAITDADAISQWLMVTDGFKPQVGAKFTLSQPGADWGNVEGEVLEVDEPNRIRYTWTNGPGFNTTVTLSLESTTGGTRLRLEHAGFDRVEGKDQFRPGAEWGWKQFLGENLPAVLDQLAARA